MANPTGPAQLTGKGIGIGAAIGGGIGALGFLAGPIVGGITTAAGLAIGGAIGGHVSKGPATILQSFRQTKISTRTLSEKKTAASAWWMRKAQGRTTCH